MTIDLSSITCFNEPTKDFLEDYAGEHPEWKPTKDLLTYNALHNDRENVYNLEFSLEDELSDMRDRMDEYGFDGEWDPTAPIHAKLNACNSRREVIDTAISELLKTSTCPHFKAVYDAWNEDCIGYAEMEYERQEERRQMGISDY